MQTAEKQAPRAESIQKPSDIRIGHKTLKTFNHLTFHSLTKEQQEEIIKESQDIVNKDKIHPLDFYTINQDIGGDTDESRKLVTACILNNIRTVEKQLKERNRTEKSIPYLKKQSDLYGTLSRTMPNGQNNLLELIDIAEQTGSNYARRIIGEIVYHANFDSENRFDKILKESSTQECFEKMPFLYKISQSSHNAWSKDALDYISDAFKNQVEDEKNPPLLRIVANTFFERIEADKSLCNETPLSAYHFFKRAEEKFNEEPQSELRKKYPDSAFRNDQKTKEIAPGYVVNIGGSKITKIISKNGKELSFVDPEHNNQLELSSHSRQLLQACYGTNGVDTKISELLSYKINKIPLGSQLALLNFMTKADNQRFNNLCTSMQNLDEDLKPKLLANFVSAGFGEDFGDSLLDIANSNRFSKEQLTEIFDSFSSCRQSIISITNLYAKIDKGHFARDYRTAANERLTDAVTVFREIAKNGHATADLDWAGEPEFEIDTAIEALQYEAKSLDIISGTMRDVSKGKKDCFGEIVLSPNSSNSAEGRTMYSFYSPDHGYVLLHTRPEASHTFNPAVEYGRTIRNPNNPNNHHAGTEASISFITNPVYPFELPSPFRPDTKMIMNPNYYDRNTMNRVSAIRLDREGRAPDQNANDAKKDPVNKAGTVSVDLAAIGDRHDTPSGKIARLISVGNKIRAEKSSSNDYSLNHNTHWFNQDKYGDADYFKGIVKHIDSSMRELCRKHPPKPSQGFTGMFSEIQKNTSA